MPHDVLKINEECFFVCVYVFICEHEKIWLDFRRYTHRAREKDVFQHEIRLKKQDVKYVQTGHS